MQPYSQHPNQNRATQAYKTSSYHGRSDAELMGELMGKLIKQLYLAQDAYTNRAFEMMNNHNIKTLHILDVLREELLASEAFKDEDARLPAAYLLQTYTNIISRLAMILSHEAPKDEFTALIDKLTPLYRGFQAAVPATPVPQGMEVMESASSAV